MDIVSLIVNLISGALGGNIAASFLKDQSLGTIGNSVAGIFGGGIGAAILQALGAFTGTGGLDVGSLIASVLSGGIGGAVVMAIIGLIKSAPAKI